MEIITRQQAKEQGLARYFTGKPCKHGHIAERYNRSQICCTCSNEHTKIRYNKNKQARDAIKQYQKEYYQKNSEYILSRVQNWTCKNKKKVKAYKKWHNEANRSRMNSLKATYKSIKKSGTLSGVKQDQIDWFYKQRDKLTKKTGISHHVDHIVPLQGKNVCGLHVPWNLQIITAEENLAKSNKWETV